MLNRETKALTTLDLNWVWRPCFDAGNMCKIIHHISIYLHMQQYINKSIDQSIIFICLWEHLFKVTKVLLLSRAIANW